MRSRLFAVTALSFALSLTGIAAPAAFGASTPAVAADAPARPAAAPGIPDGYVAMSRLSPASSTYVHNGQTVSVEYGFINTPTRPSNPVLFYRSPHGSVLTVEVDLYPNGEETYPAVLTIPASWRPGTYRLIKVVTEVLNLSGTQYRDHRYIGTKAEDTVTTVYGTSPLSLAPMDLHVLGPNHCH